ncbi:MAG: 1,4-alpha-glucan branching protein GlgB [Chlamydiota bacterium]
MKRKKDYSLMVQSLLGKNIIDPHSFLGLHSISKRKKEIRVWRPGAGNLYVEVQGKIISIPRVLEEGFFVLEVPSSIEKSDYRIYHQDGRLCFDPYAFDISISDYDVYLLKKGVHYKLYDFLGAHKIFHQGQEGMRFVVWAPNAISISLVGDFNHWDGRLFFLRNAFLSGIWEIFVPGISYGEKYKFEIYAQDGKRIYKADPFSFSQEFRPNTASITCDTNSYCWGDEEWRKKQTKNLSRPFAVYEVHLGSWKKMGKEFPNYREVAHELAAYCKEMHFTHVEFLPIMEHPLDESWGYQVTGFFAPTSRYGSFQDFQYLVDYLHQKDIGVILDWVPAHFPNDEYSLDRFDGTCLYEHADPKKGIHPHWSTNIFNYGRAEVSNFLLASALFWLDVLHADGLRVDAVSSMLYLDYGRKEGEWIPNEYQGNYNLEAIEFIKHVNSVVHERFPHALMIAEESSSFSGVTHPLDQRGLGFDMKWNMGWMNDTLRYFSKDPIHRKYSQDSLTFSLLYAFSERFCLVLSHDEVVHGKGSLLSKMPGDEWQRMANLRLLYSYMICHPGKKLLFMGAELAQVHEWNCKEELPWFLLENSSHKKMQIFVREMNHFYLSCKELWEIDFSYEGYEWIDFSDRDGSVISYFRKSLDGKIVCVHNFTSVYRPNYFIPLRNVTQLREVFTSDEEQFGGSNQKNVHINYTKEGVTLALAPLATMIFEVKNAEEKTY